MTVNTINPPAAPVARGGRAVYVTAVLCLAGLFVVSQLYVSISTLDLIAARFQVTPAQAAWVGSAFGFPYAASFLFFGPWSDQVGRRFVLTFGFTTLAAASLLVAAAESFPLLLAARAVQGICAASFSPVALSYIGELLPDHRRAVGIAALTTSLFVAGIFGQVFASEVSFHFGFGAVFQISALLFATAAILLRFTFPARPVGAGGQSFAAVLGVIPALLRDPRLLAIYAVSSLVLLGFVAFYSALGPELVMRHGLARVDLVWVRAAGVPAMLMALVVGRFLPRFGGRAFITAGLLVAGLGLAAAALPGPLGLKVAASVVFVLGTTLITPTMMYLITSQVREGRGAAAALYTLTLFAGAALGGLLAPAADAMGFALFCLTLAALYGAVCMGFRALTR